MRKALVAGIVGLGVLAGCISSQQPVANEYFYMEYSPTTNAIVDKALLACELEGVQAVPANIQTSSTPVYTSPMNCGPDYLGNITCTGGYTSGGQVSSYDANTKLRYKVSAQCMASAGISLAEAPSCPQNDLKKDRYKYNISALDILVIEFTNKTLSGLTMPPQKDTCIQPGEHDTMENSQTNSLLAYYKNWAEMNSPEDLRQKEKYRKIYMEARRPDAIKVNVFSMESEIKFCTGQIDEQGFLETIKQQWEMIGLEKSSDEMKAMFDTRSLYKNTCILGDATKSHNGWE